jgi:cell division transport system permease protein
MQSNFVWSEIWIGLRRNLTMTVALIVVVAISLSLLGTGLLFVKEVEATQSFWNGQADVVVYMCTQGDPYPQCNGAEASNAEAQAVLDEATQLPGVGTGGATFIEPQTALNMFKSNPDEKTIASTLTVGELPASIDIKTQNASADDAAVVNRFKGAPGVEQVIDEVSILGNFFNLLNNLRNAVVIVALILVIAAILLVANTIRLSAFNRRRETGIMRLVGASDFYIQLPFLLEGVIAGLIGWAVSAVMLIGVKQVVLDSLQKYTGGVGLSSSDVIQVIILAMFISALLTGTTSFVTLRRYLKV